MKNSRLITGLLSVLLGIACLSGALLSETKLEGILWGFAGAGIVPGVILVCQYFYWASPQNKDRYAQRLENEQIEMHDELKTQVRDKAGRHAYVLGIFTTCLAMIVFAVLGALEVVDHTRIILLYLFGYLLLQEFAGIFFFNRLMKKY